MKVGITVVGGQTDINAFLWSNGVGQNVANLAMVLLRLPQVSELYLVTSPDDDYHPLSGPLGVKAMSQTLAVETLDVIIELAARSITESQAERLRKRGGVLVNYLAGNVMAMNFEELATNKTYGDRVFLAGYDACWITPQHWKMNESYARLLYTPNTVQAPHVWDPMFLRLSAGEARLNPFYRKPADGRWRIGIFDPTVNINKTFHLPFLVTEEANRLRPDLIKAALLFNAYKFRESQHLLDMFAHSDLGAQKKATVEERFPIARVMGIHVDAVVTHQWESNLSYLFWDTLYLGFPLIHNSTAIQHVGYYYPEFDPQAGGRVLVEALETHDARRVRDRPAVLETLWGFSVENPAVQKTYSDLLTAAFDQRIAPAKAKVKAKGKAQPKEKTP